MCCELCGHDSPAYRFVSFVIHDGDVRPVCEDCFDQERRQCCPPWSVATLHKDKEAIHANT